MRTFDKWGQLENMNCRVIINHALFGQKQYDCDMLQIINDEHRIGVVIKGRKLYVHKHNVKSFFVYDTLSIVADDMMTIEIVNNM